MRTLDEKDWEYSEKKDEKEENLNKRKLLLHCP